MIIRDEKLLYLYKIIPNSFEPLEVNYEDVDRLFRKITKKHCNLQYFRIRYNNLKKKIKSHLRKQK